MSDCSFLRQKRQVLVNGEWVDTRSFRYLPHYDYDDKNAYVSITGGHQGDEIQIGFVALKHANDLLGHNPYDYVKTMTLYSDGSGYIEVGSDECITMINPISPERFGSSTHIVINNCNFKCLLTPFVEFQGNKEIGEGTLSINNSMCVGGRDSPLIHDNSFSSITFNNFDTSKVTDVRSMFSGCIGVTSLNLSGWDTRLVESMDCTFVFCDKLQSVDLSGWDFSNVKNHYEIMNCACYNLKTVYARGCNQATIDEFKKGFPSATIVTE